MVKFIKKIYNFIKNKQTYNHNASKQEKTLTPVPTDLKFSK